MGRYYVAPPPVSNGYGGYYWPPHAWHRERRGNETVEWACQRPYYFHCKVDWWPNVPLALVSLLWPVIVLGILFTALMVSTLASKEVGVGSASGSLEVRAGALGYGLEGFDAFKPTDQPPVPGLVHSGVIRGVGPRPPDSISARTTTPRFLVVRRGPPVTINAEEPLEPVVESKGLAPNLGNVWSCAEIERAAVARGFSSEGARTVAAIAMAESGGRSAATAITPRERSYGPLQVNVLAHPHYSEESLRSLGGAIEAAWRISNGGKSFSPWTAWTSGKSEGRCG